MTEQEGQTIKAKLIEFGSRGAEGPGDPMTDIHDARALHDRIQAKLAKDCSWYRGCLLSVYRSFRSRIIEIPGEPQNPHLIGMMS